MKGLHDIQVTVMVGKYKKGDGLGQASLCCINIQNQILVNVILTSKCLIELETKMFCELDL